MARRSPYPAFGLTDQGRVRDHNEDAYLLDPPLYVVADGLGGHRAGEVASGIAIDILASVAPRNADALALGKVVRHANTAIVEAARQGRGRQGMGTTLTAAIIEGDRLAIAHVGDSRAYLLSGDGLVQLTDDHSMVADLIREGSLSPEEARYHPHRNVITRALGTDETTNPDTYEFQITRGDRLLLSTDGLHGVLDEREIEDILRTASSPESAAQALITSANRAGGPDNITAVIVDIGAPGPGSAEGRTGRTTRGWLVPLLWALAAIAIVVGAIVGLRAYAFSRAFVIAQDGVIAVYSGVPGEFAGVSLNELEQRTDVRVDDLGMLNRDSVTEGITTESLAAAFEVVGRLSVEASRNAGSGE